MWMWLGIMIVTLVCVILALVYLVSRVGRFSMIEKCFKDKKRKKMCFSIVMVALFMVALSISMDIVNMMVCILYLVIIWIFCDFVAWLIRKVTKKNWNNDIQGILAILFTVIYLGGCWYICHHVVETDYLIHTEKNLEGDQLRVVLFADSHVGSNFDGNGFAIQMEKVQRTNPDVVLITGDFVDDSTKKADMIEACKALGNLKTSYGVYFVFGNHDKGYYGSNRGFTAEDLCEQLECNGVTILQDRIKNLNNHFCLVGRQDAEVEDRASMKELTKEWDKNKFLIVMDHQPVDYLAQEESRVDLVLSGHTHGGQLFPLNFAMNYIGENCMIYGLKKQGNTNFIVTSGLSDWAIKFKSGCCSEFVVIDIR